MIQKSKIIPFAKRLKTKEQAFQAIELLRHAVDTMSSYFLLWDHDDRLIVCNEKVFQLYPNSRDIFVMGRTFEDIMRMGIEKGDFDTPKEMTSEEWIQHRTMLHKRGNYVEIAQINERWVQVRDQRTIDGYIVSNSVDVTYLKQQEEELLLAKERAIQAEEFLQDAINTISDVFTLWDKNDQLIAYNKRLFKLFPNAHSLYIAGRTYEEIMRLGVAKGDFIVPEGITPSQWIDKRVAGHKSGDYSNIRYLRGRWLQIRDRRTPKGNTVSTAIDVTLLKEREHELELARTQAEQATKAKSKFLAMLSHELRTPLHSVMNMGQLLLKSNLGVRQHEKVMTILDSSQALLTTIEDLLDFSKIEAGKINSEKTEFDLKTMIEGVMSLYNAPVQKKNLSFSYYIDPKLPHYLCGEAGKIRQVLINLVGNAVKFTDQGYVLIHAKAISYATHAIKMSIAVEDTGIGLTLEEQKKIFTEFTQAHEDIAKQYGGTGLGLAICDKLVHAIGGKIEVKSCPKKGSTFRVTCYMEPGQKTHEAFSWQGFKGDFNIPSMRVLLVEDDPSNQKTTQSVLDYLGHRVDIVSDGYEALYQLTQKSYDFVIMDIQLPGINGYKTAHRIRTLPAPTCSIPIIGMSAQSTEEDAKKGIVAGMNAYLTKPVNIWCLQKAIAKIKDYPERQSFAKKYQTSEYTIGQDQCDKPHLVTIDQDYLRHSFAMIDLADIQALIVDYEHAVKYYNRKFHGLMAQEEKDYEAIYRLMSDFKGSSGYFGLRRLMSIVDNILAGAEAQDSNKIERYYAKTMDEINIALPILKNLYGIKNS